MRKILCFLLLCFSALFVSAQDSALHEYKGIYKFMEGSPTPSVEISIVNGALYASASIGSASLVRVSKDTFSIPEHNGMAFFYRNPEGKVKSIKVEVGDMVLEGDKETASLAVRRKRLTVYSK